MAAPTMQFRIGVIPSVLQFGIGRILLVSYIGILPNTLALAINANLGKKVLSIQTNVVNVNSNVGKTEKTI
jgi:hypothetical protein